MYTLKDLFNQRSAFAARLEQFIDSYPITKTQTNKNRLTYLQRRSFFSMRNQR